jgi:ribonuclease P protein subunit POP4
MVKKIYPHELIGQEIEIIDSKNKSNLHLKGKIVDETKYTIKITHQGEIKTLMKDNIVFKLRKTNQIIKGETITKRPEERIKGK